MTPHHDPVWHAPPDRPALAADGVHVWRAALARSPEDLDRLGRTLSPDEWDRARRFRFEAHRRHFVAARGILRALLGRYLERDPAGLQFDYGPQGKPALIDPPAAGLRFNLAHSGGMALYALTRDRELGVDLERVDDAVRHEEVAGHFFSPRERAALAALPAEGRAGGFFTCWVRKEAYLKARGGGLSIPLDSFDVSLTPGEPARLLATRDDPDHAVRWSVRELDPGPGYAGALVFAGLDFDLWCGQYPDSETG